MTARSPSIPVCAHFASSCCFLAQVCGPQQNDIQARRPPSRAKIQVNCHSSIVLNFQTHNLHNEYTKRTLNE
jgi:hypothetical protein